MTIRRGERWGEPGTLAAGSPVVADDAALRHLVVAALEAGGTPPEVGLVGGDLFRTLGGTTGRSRLDDGTSVRYPIDVVEVRLDDVRTWFVAHLVARRRWWTSRTVVAMNAAFVGRWNLGPRAHPNDGRVDVTDGRLRLTELVEARRRMPSGAHLPHPALAERRTGRLEVVLDRPTPIWLDGERASTAVHIELLVVADAAVVVA
ncbi:MAG TPA: hypothetical protein VJM33_12630 [Microthrixaceae bacterium]|nr:hypothetical protein [Microthrixaceae bacterium]